MFKLTKQKRLSEEIGQVVNIPNVLHLILVQYDKKWQ